MFLATQPTGKSKRSLIQHVAREYLGRANRQNTEEGVANRRCILLDVINEARVASVLLTRKKNFLKKLIWRGIKITPLEVAKVAFHTY